MDDKHIRLPIPILLISTFFIITTLYSGYELLFVEKQSNSASAGFWANLLPIVTGMIVGVGLLRKSKIAYILFVVETLISFVGIGFMVTLLFWTDTTETDLWLIVMLISAFILLFVMYRYMRSAKIRNLYFPEKFNHPGTQHK